MMKQINRSLVLIVGFAIILLFLIQSAGVLVESIYILDLMNTSLDEKAAGVLFLFSPLLLFLVRGKWTTWAAWICTLLLVAGRGLLPYQDTTGRLLASGLAAATALLLLPIWLSTYFRNHQADWRITAQGFALAGGVSILLRTLNATLDISLEISGAWLGWVLGILLALCTTFLSRKQSEQGIPVKTGGLVSAGLGMGMLLALAHFVLFAPGVLARWANVNYVALIGLASAVTLLYLLVSLQRPQVLENLSPMILLIWNLGFSLVLALAAVVNTPAFPQSPDSQAVIVGQPGLPQQGLVLLAVLLSPIIYQDFFVFSRRMVQQPAARLAPGFLLGSGLWAVLIFLNIFSNVWGYIEPVSTPFRGKYWLPFLLAAGLAAFFCWRLLQKQNGQSSALHTDISRVSRLFWRIGLAGVFLVTVGTALKTEAREDSRAPGLLVMTYNIQQANDGDAQRSFERQMELIRQVGPDILALQENDSARISFNNNDYVRYYASQMGYYVVYGPPTPAGTFGTALLSRYPLENPAVIYTFSDADENAITRAEIDFAGRQLTIFNVHPDGSDQADAAFARAVLEQIGSRENVIVLGDFNLRQSSPAYQQIARVLQNAWLAVYPGGVDANGLDMSGDRRIDHIFYSPGLAATAAFYILPPDSATDHPVHWARLDFK